MPGMAGLSGMPGLPGMPGYPPMGNYSYMRPPGLPQSGSSEPSTDSESLKMIEEQMRMQQQMYMYYYGMYGLNPMFNPGYMNPYPGPMGMPMGPMGPMGPLGPMSSMNPLGPIGSYPPKMPPK